MVPGYMFQKQSGFILSPHIGCVTNDAYVNMGLDAARNALVVRALERDMLARSA